MHLLSLVLSCYTSSDKLSLNALVPMIPRIATSWYTIGLKLGARDFTLNLIKQSHKNVPQPYCNEKLACGLGCMPSILILAKLQ